MAIVIRNGAGYYVAFDENGKLIKVTDIAVAEIYLSVSRAINEMRDYPKKTKSYYVYDTDTQKVCWRWRTKRKHYSKGVRRMLYNKADGRCQLCGRKILFESITLDHIIPLKMGGKDNIDNLQIACNICNRSKSSYLPDAFQDRIFDALCFNMGKKHGDSLKWKLTYRLLLSLR